MLDVQGSDWTRAVVKATRCQLGHVRGCAVSVNARVRLWLGLLSLVAVLHPAQAQEADPVAGKVVFDDWCRPCHDVEPRKHPGTAALQFLYKGEKPAALELRLDLTPDIVSYYVRTGVSIMPFFRKTEIDDQELRDLGAYLSPDNLRARAE